MFTIKLYSYDDRKLKIMEAESFTILRGDKIGDAEITLHRKNLNDSLRVDIKPGCSGNEEPGHPEYFDRAIIENEAGRTTEMIGARLPRRETQPNDAALKDRAN